MKISIWICVLALLLGCMAPPKTPAKAPGSPPASAQSEEPVPVEPSGSGPGGGSGTGGGPSSSSGGSQEPKRSQTRVPKASIAAQLSGADRKKNNLSKPRPFRESSQLPGYDEVSLSYPAPLSEDSLKNGDRLYKKYCDSCHGVAGLPSTENASLARFGMADLRDPEQYKFGDGKRAIFRTISYGTPASPMAGYKDQLSQAEIWDLTNYVTRKFQGREG